MTDGGERGKCGPRLCLAQSRWRHGQLSRGHGGFFCKTIKSILFLSAFDKFFICIKCSEFAAGARQEECSLRSRLGNQLLVQLPQMDMHWFLTFLWFLSISNGPLLTSFALYVFFLAE